MEERLERYGHVACAGAAFSGLMGISVLIYYSAALIQLELEKTEGINETQSNYLAAGICLSGVGFIVAVSLAAGACIGDTPNYFYEAARSCGHRCHDFFQAEQGPPHQPQPTATMHL